MFSPTSANVTVMFPSGAGVEVRHRGETMTTTILLPEEFKNSTLGLLGKMNGNAEDDLTLSNGELVLNYSKPEELFNFGASCKRSPQIFSAQILLEVLLYCVNFFDFKVKCMHV